MNKKLLLKKRFNIQRRNISMSPEILFFSDFIKKNNIKEINILYEFTNLKKYIVENVSYEISDNREHKLFIGIDDFTIRKLIKNSIYSYVFIDESKLQNKSLMNILKYLKMKELRYVNLDNILENSIVKETLKKSVVRSVSRSVKSNNKIIDYYDNFKIPVFSKDKILKDFVLDFNLMEKVYKIPNKSNIINYYKNNGIQKGFIINLNQIQKFYNCSFDGSNIIYNNIKYNCNNFVNEKIYNIDFDSLFDKIIIKKDINIINKNVKTIILIHTGNNEKFIDILKKFSKKDNVLFLISTVNNLENNLLKKFNIKNYVIYTIKNVGNDLIPSIKMYNDFKDKIKFNYVLKLHTKNNSNIFNNFIDIFSSNYKNILKMLDNNKQYEFCSINKYILSLTGDIYNKKFVPKNSSKFCSISFFFGRKEIINNNINKLRFLLKPSLINNFYYDNIMFNDNSPVHSIERLISNSNNILGINTFTNYKIAVNIASHISNDLDLYLLENNINKIKNNNIDIYVYYTGKIKEDFIRRNYNVTFKKSNNSNLDFGKHFHFYNDNIQKYSHFILTNDSIIILDSLNSFIDYIKYNNYNLIGYLESNEIKQHYQSWMLYLNKETFNILKKNFSNSPSHKIELDFIENIKKKNVFYRSHHNLNIFFHKDLFDEYYNNFNFRILKKKQVILVISKEIYKMIDISKLPKINLKLKTVPKDFNCINYLKYNHDLECYKNNIPELRKHFITSGIYDFRKYTDNNIYVINPLFETILGSYKINISNFL